MKKLLLIAALSLGVGYVLGNYQTLLKLVQGKYETVDLPDQTNDVLEYREARKLFQNYRVERGLSGNNQTEGYFDLTQNQAKELFNLMVANNYEKARVYFGYDGKGIHWLLINGIVRDVEQNEMTGKRKLDFITIGGGNKDCPKHCDIEATVVGVQEN